MTRDELEQKRISLSYKIALCHDFLQRERLQKKLSKLIKILEQEDIKEYNQLGDVIISDLNIYDLTIPKER